MSALLVLLVSVLFAAPALAEPRLTASETISIPSVAVRGAAEGEPSEKNPNGFRGGSSGVPGVRAGEPSEKNPNGVRAGNSGLPGIRATEPNSATIPADSPFAWAATRLVVACALVGVALVGGLKLYRRSLQPGPRASRRRGASWLARWVPTSAEDGDRITLLARNYLGTRESVCVLRVGTERFLVGVTSAQISMLGRLGAGESTERVSPARAAHRAPLAASVAAPEEPSEFSELMTVASNRGGGDAELRQALARSRARLAEIVAGRGTDA